MVEGLRMNSKVNLSLVALLSIWATMSCASTPGIPRESDPELVPLPREIERIPGEASTRRVILRGSGRAADELRAWVEPSSDPSQATEIFLACGPEAARRPEWALAGPKQLGEEGYLLTVTDRKIVLLANTETGLFRGTQTLRQLRRPDGTIAGVRIRDYPAQPHRGFKGWGPNWKVEDYLAMPEYMARFKLNFLMLCYASFEESFVKFRTPYPETMLADFRNLARECDRRFIHLCVSINPSLFGGDIRYSNDEDFRRLRDKCASILDCGIHWIAIALDDIEPELQDPEDRKRFKSFGEAHAFLVNRLLKDLKAKDPDVRIIFCPTLYWTIHDPQTPYYADLRRDLSPEVFCFWTGPEIISRTITGDDAVAEARALGRPPFLWDNYPVVDNIEVLKLLGPFVQRSLDLPYACSGFMGNSMRFPRLSMFPNVTLGDYLWNPEAYDPERSIAQAILHLVGPRLYPTVRELVDCYTQPPAPFEMIYAFVEPLHPTEEKLEKVRGTADRLRRIAPILEKEMPPGAMKSEILACAIENYLRFARLYLAWGDVARAERAILEAFRSGKPTEALIEKCLGNFDTLGKIAEPVERAYSRRIRSTNIFALSDAEDNIGASMLWRVIKSHVSASRARVERYGRTPDALSRAVRGWDQDTSTLEGGRLLRPDSEGLFLQAAERLSATFRLETPKPKSITLKLVAKDERPERCTIVISVNGQPVFDEMSGLSDRWTEKTIVIPGSALAIGENRLEIRNAQSKEGAAGRKDLIGILRLSLNPN